METECLPYKDTGYFSKIIIDYLEGADQIQPFYQYQPHLDSFKEAIANKEFGSQQRATLVESLYSQYANGDIKLKADSQVKSNIELLREERTFTVTTGHQLCLFTGPLYFIYKILSTIKLTKELQLKYPDQHFVPIYWMASEDHDFEEINHFYFNGKKIEWKTKQKGAVGRMNLSGMEAVLTAFADQLPDYSTPAEELKDLFEAAYIKHKNLADATRYLVHQLFGKYGLIILDGDDASLKAQFKPILKEELLKETSSELVEKQNKKLAEHYKIQVNPRSINLFYLKEDSRKRILKENDSYFVHETSLSFSEEELLKELDTYPERFSPNVILRPLYQERTLPNLAYIGGGGELAYWFQLKTLFEHFNIPMPVLILRNSVMWMNEKQSKYYKSLNIPIDQLFLESGVLLKNWIKENAEEDLTLQKELAEFKKQYSLLAQKAERVDASLEPHVQALLAKQQKTIERLSEKLIRSERRKQGGVEQKIKFLKETLFPNNGLQERYDNIASLYLSDGPEVFDRLMELFEVPGDQFYSFTQKQIVNT